MDTIAVIGAGIMGTGIAQTLIMSGYIVELVDLNSDILDRAIININNSLEDALKKGIVEADDKDKLLNQVVTKNSIDELSDNLYLIIEAATEDYSSKVKIFKSLDKICNNHTIFATNTSCLPVTELAKQTSRRNKFIGMHFFYPAERNKLVEIIPTKYTDEEVLKEILRFADIIDKVAITSKDSPGFCVNRFFVPYLNEATRFLSLLLYEDDIYTINYAAKDSFKAPFGPFEIMNLTGTSLALNATSELGEALGDFYQPSELLKKYGRENTPWDLPEMTKFKDMESAAFHDTPIMKKRFQGLVMNICATLAENNIASVTDINLGARIGLGWKTGPFDLMNDLGPSKVYHYNEELIAEYPSLTIPEILDEVDFWETLSTRYTKNNNIAEIKLWRPEALNALSEKLLTELDEHVYTALNDDEIKLITLTGSPKVFSAGADLKFLIDCLKNNELQKIFDYTEFAHKVLNKLSNSPKPVIALIDGIAFGGGLELALACQFIISTSKSTFQFPETNIGIFPGFGGTQRLPRRVSIEIARYMILLGIKISAHQAIEYGLIDKLTSNKLEAINFINELASVKDIGIETILKNHKKTCQPSDETMKNLKLLRNVELLISRKLISKRAREMSDILHTKPIQAINIAHNLINKSTALNIDDGLKLEMSYIKEIFKQNNLIEHFQQALKR